MPPTQRGQAVKLSSGRWSLRYYDAAGTRRRKSPFPSKSTALAHYRDVIEPQLRGGSPVAPELTLRHYGTLLDGSAAGVAQRLDAFDIEGARHCAEAE